VQDESVGAINGDLNSRLGRLVGMDPKGGITTINDEVPMAEVLTYNQALTSLTGGRGDYHMQFLRYDEVPAHIAQKLIDAAKGDKEAVPA
jgi:elongation factor G